MKPIEVLKIYDKIPDDMLGRIKSKIYTVHSTLDTVIYHTKEPVPYNQRMSGTEMKIKIGDVWGDVFDCAWFHFTGVVPEICKDKKVVLILDVGGEGCIYDENGAPKRGITTFTANNAPSDWGYKRVVPFLEVANGGETVDFWVDCGYNDLFGNLVWGSSTPADPRPYKEGFIATVNEEMRALYYDYLVLNDLRTTLADTDPRYYSILYALVDVKKILINWTDDEVKKARKILKKELDKKGGTPSLSFSAVGHSHLDLAWLWPIRESKRKAIRTFSTQLEMIDRYPDYIYGASQPQMYEWIKRLEPKLYERIKTAVASGRIEPQGCMWVESDTNVPSGESLVRQIFYGKKFFKDEFGKEIETLWLPDVFGFSATIPQLCEKSNVKYLCTIKLSWNWITEFPHHSFIWKGLTDNSVLVHMPPEGEYNSMAFPNNVQRATFNYREKGIVENALMLFGIGDGGAGPAPRHLESLKRIRNLSGMPPVKQEHSTAFFKKLERQADKLQTYRGEMYLEAHQGTYTSQGKNKKNNKVMENLLHDVECIYAIENILYGRVFPQAEIDEIWKETLLYQFHDILPGSSIKRVYNETEDAYNRLIGEVNAYISQITDAKEHNAVYNPHGFTVSDVVEKEGKLYLVEAKPLGYTFIDERKEIKSLNCSFTDNTLSNDKIVAKFGDDGRLLSVVRKSDGRNSLSAIGGNLLSVYHDNCTYMCGDAWDIDPIYYKTEPEYFTLTGVRTYIEGASAVREQTYTYGKSTLTQKIKLSHGGECLEFDCEVDWQETNKNLRVDFNTDINTDFVTCGVQFGKINRTTKENDPTQRAQFEICAHRYSELSENSYKFAVLSDCKYGYRVKDKLISLNLLRSPEYPATEARGIHKFRYGVYCGQNANDVEKVGYKFINGLKPCYAQTEFSLVNIDKDSILTETLKPAYGTSGQILRLYESSGEKTVTTLKFDHRIKSVTLCNLMEEPIKVLPIKDGKVKLAFNAFEIHTLKLN